MEFYPEVKLFDWPALETDLIVSDISSVSYYRRVDCAQYFELQRLPLAH